MKIYTSYFNNLKNIPPDIVRFSIARTTPEDEDIQLAFKSHDIQKLQILIPPDDMFGYQQYVSRYSDEILRFIDVNKLVHYLDVKSNGKDIVLLCFEHSNQECHRRVVSDWLNRNGIRCKEYNIKK